MTHTGWSCASSVGDIGEEFALAIWSRWFGGGSRGITDKSPPFRPLTIGEVVKTVEAESPSTPVQRCLLCEATAAVEVHVSEAHIECAACGQYSASLDAARALDALVKYRAPALAEMRKIVEAYRQNYPNGVPKIDVRYVVSDGVPTFVLPSE